MDLPQIGQTISAEDFKKLQSQIPQIGETISAEQFKQLSNNPSANISVVNQQNQGQQENIYGYSPNAPQQENNLSKIFGGAKLGTKIGQGLADFFSPEAQRLKQLDPALAQKALQPTVSYGQAVGDILRAGANIATLATPVPELMAGRALINAGLGTASRIGAGLANKENPSDILQSLPGTAVASSVLPEVAGGILNTVSKGLSSLGTKIQIGVIKPTATDVADGFNIGNVNKYNVGGSLQTTLTKTNQLMDSLSNQLSEKIRANPEAKIDFQQVFNKTAEKLNREPSKNFGFTKSLVNAVNSLENELKNVVPTGTGDLVTAQNIKRGAGTMGAWQFGIPAAEANATEKVYTTFYNVLKKEIEKTAPEGVKEINQKLSELIPIHNAVIRRLPVAERNSAISLGEAISLAHSVSNPAALAIFAAQKALKMGQVGNFLSKLPQQIIQPGQTLGRLGKAALFKLLTK